MIQYSYSSKQIYTKPAKQVKYNLFQVKIKKILYLYQKRSKEYNDVAYVLAYIRKRVQNIGMPNSSTK